MFQIMTLLPLLLSFAATPGGHEMQSPAGPVVARQPATVSVHCEVWGITSPELEAQIEAQVEAAPKDAARVLKLARGSAGGASKLARLLVPVTTGKQLVYSTSVAMPMFSREAGKASGFPDYQRFRSEFQVSCLPRENNAIETSLKIQIDGLLEAKDSKAPASRTSLRMTCTTTDLTGARRVFVFDAGPKGTVLVFLNATAL